MWICCIPLIANLDCRSSLFCRVVVADVVVNSKLGGYWFLVFDSD